MCTLKIQPGTTYHLLRIHTKLQEPYNSRNKINAMIVSRKCNMLVQKETIHSLTVP